MPNITTVHMSQDDIDLFIKHENPWKEIVDAPGILKSHHAVCKISESVVLYSNNMETSNCV